MTINAVGGTTPPLGTQGPDGAGGREHVRKAMDAVAQKLGLSPDELRSKLESGSSLADLAKAQGVSLDDLKSTITQALTGDGSKLTADQASQLADRLVSRTGGHHHGHHHHHSDSSSVSATTPTTAVDPSSSTSSTSSTGAAGAFNTFA
jgi:hypothetical protein